MKPAASELSTMACASSEPTRQRECRAGVYHDGHEEEAGHPRELLERTAEDAPRDAADARPAVPEGRVEKEKRGTRDDQRFDLLVEGFETKQYQATDGGQEVDQGKANTLVNAVRTGHQLTTEGDVGALICSKVSGTTSSGAK